MAEFHTIPAEQLRVKRLDRSSMWDDYEFGVPGKYFGYHSHFTQFIADEWTITEATDGDPVLADEVGGVLNLVPGGTENQGTQLALGGTAAGETTGECFAPTAGKKIFFEAKFKMVDADQTDFFIGLASEDTSIIASDPTTWLGFRVTDESATVDFKCGSTTVEAVATATDATYLKVGFKCAGTSYCEVWVDDKLVSTITTGIPTALMKLSLALLTGEAAVNTTSVDYITCYQEM